MRYDPVFAFRLGDEDQAVLAALVAHERLTRSDIIRRALRAYAKQLGVKPQSKPKRKK